MSEDYDTTELMITNNERVFGGNAVQLMTALYKAEQLPVRVRLYAASKTAEFELPGAGGYQETVGHDGEDYGEKLVRHIEVIRQSMSAAEIIRENLEQLITRRNGELTDEDRRFVSNITQMVEERLPSSPTAVILPPVPPERTFRKVEAVTIDGEADGVGGSHRRTGLLDCADTQPSGPRPPL